MRQVATALIAIAWLAAAAAWDPTLAQPTPSPSQTVSIGFRNLTDVDVFVQGYSLVNGSVRRGVLIAIPKKGGVAFESNVPTGLRLYNVHDANQSSRILLRDHRVLIQNRASFAIVPSKTSPGQVVLVPEP